MLRALGMNPRQTRLVPSTQAVYALAGLAFGLPLGVAAGRVLWQVVSDQTPLAYRAPQNGAVLVLVAATTLLAVPGPGRAGRPPGTPGPDRRHPPGRVNPDSDLVGVR